MTADRDAAKERETEQARKLDYLQKVAVLCAHYENALTKIANHDLHVDYADVELRDIARRVLREHEGSLA